MKNTQTCEHEYASLGFNVFKVGDTLVEAVAAIHCTKCGMFRTKILTFIREVREEDKSARQY